MDPTTLVTFLYRAPPEARAVELLGSWDNFTASYQMYQDRRRGRDSWSGCFKFENIIFDGCDLQWTKPRSGGLKEGATYWYYYRINYDIETFDAVQPSTTLCPFLPGQTVNVIDVPIELLDAPTRCHSAYGDIVGTLSSYAENQSLDPATKFAVLSPPPKSRVHKHCLSDDALNGRLERATAVTAETYASPRVSSTLPLESTGTLRREAYRPERTMDREIRSLRSSDALPEDYAVSSVDKEHEWEFPLPGHGIERAVLAYQDDKLPISAHSYAMDAGIASAVSLISESDTAEPSSKDHCSFECFEDSLPQPLSPIVEESPRISDIPTRVLRQKSSECSLGPSSVQNVQFYGSRPGSALDESPRRFRPRTHSVARLDLMECMVDGSSASCTAESPDISTDDQDDEIPTPFNDIDPFDLTSPTFSGATLSTDGQNTPSRLSGIYESNSTPPSDDDDDDDAASLVEMTQSFRVLNTHEHRSHRDGHLLRVPKNDYAAHRLTPSGYLNYSLPTHALESTLSLAKTRSSTPRNPTWANPLSTARPTEEANAIFSELGYLSSRIA